MPTSPDGAGFSVEQIEPDRSLVLVIRQPDAVVSSAYVLDQVAAGRTRLVNRVRFRVRPTPRSILWALAMDAGHFVIARRMLLGVKQRVERLAQSQASVLDPEVLA